MEEEKGHSRNPPVMVEPLLEHLRHQQGPLPRPLAGHQEAPAGAAGQHPLLHDGLLVAQLLAVEEVHRQEFSL